ncbi:MAG: alpha/beta hydrolase [Rhizomicrobium sp.]
MKLFIGLVVVLILAAFSGWLALRAPDIPYQVLEAKYANSDSHFVDLPGGVHLHYRDEGRVDRPLLLLVHGFGDSLWTWDGWVETLKSKFHIIRIDLPGHGLTRAPANYRLSAETYADLIDDFAAKRSLPKFAIAGNSLGGGVAWQLALRHPDRVDALILVDAAGWPSKASAKSPPLAFRILQYRIGREFLKTIDNKPLIIDSLKSEVGDKFVITPALVDRWAELQRVPGHRDILLSTSLSGQSFASKEKLDQIRIPTLVLWGQIDPLLSVEDGHKFADAITGSRLIVYPHVGHLPQIEIPERSATDVAEFLTSIAASRK